MKKITKHLKQNSNITFCTVYCELRCLFLVKVSYLVHKCKINFENFTAIFEFLSRKKFDDSEIL